MAGLRDKVSSMAQFRLNLISNLQKKNECTKLISFPSKGFSIVEVLVALGLVAIVGAGMAAVMSSAGKQQKGIQAKDQQREISAEIRSLLSKSVACKFSFGGNNPAAPGFSANAIKDENNIDRYNKTNKSTDKTGLLQFIDFKVLVSPSDPANADLTVLLSKIGDTGTVKNIRPDNIKLRIKLDGAGLITDCVSIGTVTDGFWQIGTPNPNDIYFSAGNVGIGTANPGAAVDVVTTGVIPGRFSGTSSGPTSSGGVGVLVVNSDSTVNTWSGVYFNDSSTGPLSSSAIVTQYTDRANHYADIALTTRSASGWSEKLYVTSSGNVGIGTTTPTAKLEVTGSIKPGAATTGTACGSEGAFAYDFSAHAPVYCSNTGAWTAMGGSGGFGGSYLVDTFGGTCSAGNPKTGGCSCPAGMGGYLSGQAFRWSQWDTTIVNCY